MYAANVARQSADDCVNGLTRLLDDEDEQVRNQVVGFFGELRGDHLLTLRDFLKAFASSRSLHHGLRKLADFLLENGLLDAETTLSLVEKAIENGLEPGPKQRYFDGEGLIRAVLRIYSDPVADERTRTRAMNVFDALMDRYAAWANNLLEEWDRI